MGVAGRQRPGRTAGRVRGVPYRRQPRLAVGAAGIPGHRGRRPHPAENITSTVITVIALVLGLTVVALQLSSTQFSPRLLRNFLRDRPNQIVLSIFVATFVYAAAGLYTVGLAVGNRTEDFPRLAVSGALVLMFISLAMVVFFADHLAHSIQVDAIGTRVEQDTLTVVHGRLGRSRTSHPPRPRGRFHSPPPLRLSADRAPRVAAAPGHRTPAPHPAPRPGRRTHRRRHDPGLDVDPHPGRPVPDPAAFRHDLDASVRVGFERTQEQDAAFGIRQLVDMACKALSPAVNDPYTAVQAVDHLSVIFCALAVRPLGDYVASDPAGTGVVIVPARRFGDYLATMCGLIRRYGSSEPTLSVALLRLLANCAAVLPDDPARWTALGEQADLILDDAMRETAQPVDTLAVQAAARDLQATITAHRPTRRE